MCAGVESSWAGVGSKDLDTWFRTSVTFRFRALDWTPAASVHFCMAMWKLQHNFCGTVKAPDLFYYHAASKYTLQPTSLGDNSIVWRLAEVSQES